jgi:hypothetical protein
MGEAKGYGDDKGVGRFEAVMKIDAEFALSRRAMDSPREQVAACEAQPGCAADCQKRPLRSRFRQRLPWGVSAHDPTVVMNRGAYMAQAKTTKATTVEPQGPGRLFD